MRATSRWVTAQLYNGSRVLAKADVLEIEPNETAHETATFILPWAYSAVQIRLFIPAGTSGAYGWTATVYHDTGTAQEDDNVEPLQEV